MRDVRQSQKWASYMEKIGWEKDMVGNCLVYLKKIPFFGFAAKIQRPNEPISLKQIDSLIKKYKLAAIYLEPATNREAEVLESQGFRLAKIPFLPTKTIHLDLSPSEKQLIAQMKKDARGAIRKTGSIQPIEVSDLEKFYIFWKRSASWNKWVPPLSWLVALKEAFGNDVLFCEVPNLAGAVFVISENAAYYLFAFTGKAGRKGLAQYKLVWEGIKWAKKRKAKVFDFEGIYDPRFPHPSWKGFSHFKNSFGGYEVEYPGCFVKNYTLLGKIIFPAGR